MNLRSIIYLIILALAAIAAACGGSESPAGKNTNNNSGNTADNMNAQPVNAEGPLGTTKKPEEATSNQAPTLSPVFRAYCEAMAKKDDAALRRVFAAETLKILEKDSKDEKKSIAEYLTELEKIKDPNQCVARNEKIDGATGVAELKSETMPSWTAIEFVSENGVWKMTNKSPDLKSVKESATAPGSK